MNAFISIPKIAIVVPCYNEEEVLPESSKLLSAKLTQLINKNIINPESKIVFVDDGSKDNTWNLIEKYFTDEPQFFNGVKLSGNRGHQHALLCGILTVRNHFDAVITIDADLQDDIDIFDKMIELYCAGNEIVYGVKEKRKTDGLFKRFTAHMFYKLMIFLGVKVIYNHADFRLMGSKALDALSEYNEVNLFLRGIIPLLGFKSSFVFETISERKAGVSKYTLGKMIGFAINGITSFSTKPIRMITLLGILLLIISISLIVYFIVDYFTGHTVSGWATIVCSLWGIGGLILFSMGIIGEYIGKIYLETKNRPRFHVEKYLSSQAEE